MNAATQSTARATVNDGSVPVRAPRFRLPRRDPAPKGRAQGQMRELLGFIATRSETYAFRYDDGGWMFVDTNRDMLNGSLAALDPLGITVDHRIEQTDSPNRFQVIAPDGSDRTLELSWDSIGYDLMSLPPHVKRYDPRVAALVVLAAVAACWAGIYAVVSWIAGLF